MVSHECFVPVDMLHYPALSTTASIVGLDPWLGEVVHTQALAEPVRIDAVATFVASPVCAAAPTPSLASMLEVHELVVQGLRPSLTSMHMDRAGVGDFGGPSTDSSPDLASSEAVPAQASAEPAPRTA